MSTISSAYDDARNDLFHEICTSQGTSTFHTYWSGFRNFIIGQLSKEEFDLIALNALGDIKVYLHNRLVMIIMDRITSCSRQSLELSSQLASEILLEFASNENEDAPYP